MCLLNREIFDNSSRGRVSTSQPENIEEFLNHILLDRLDPAPLRHALTLNKSCRFVDPVLEPRGVTTQGRLWKLSPDLILTNKSDFKGQWVPSIPLQQVAEPLGLQGHKNLLKLARKLRRKGYVILAEDVEFLLEEIAGGRCSGSEQWLTFRQGYMADMACAVADAIGIGLPLKPGCISRFDGGGTAHIQSSSYGTAKQVVWHVRMYLLLSLPGKIRHH